jgi:hypothetical protein
MFTTRHDVVVSQQTKLLLEEELSMVHERPEEKKNIHINDELVPLT